MTSQADQPLSTDVNREAFDMFVSFINSGDSSLAERVISADAVFYAPGSDQPLTGPEGWMRVLAPLRSAFPDISWEVLETVAEGETIVARFSVRGTHRSDFLGIPATDRAVQFDATNFYRFSDRQITEELGQPDLLALFAQLGSFPRDLAF